MMQVIRYPDPAKAINYLRRPILEYASLEASVQALLLRVRQEGDEAVRDFTQRFDKVSIDQLEIDPERLRATADRCPTPLQYAIKQACDNIRRFHEQQREPVQVVETMPGVRCWRRAVPIEQVGLYIPGGTAPLFSTVLMLAVPAKIAGCSNIVLCTPPDKNGQLHPAIAYAALLAGVDRVFLIGGVQAIGAMAYGTQTVPKVDKIFGPGNQYVTMAKQLVAKEDVAIDMPAGPSEVLVYADQSAQPEFVAADLLSQAEHGIDSQVVLLSLDEALIDATLVALDTQLQHLPRRQTAQAALANSKAMLLRSDEEALRVINAYAPEHLILSVHNYEQVADRVINAGSVFLGHYTPESAGDYASGTNHTLPTNGFARAYSGVSLDSFVKKITFQEISHEGLRKLGPIIQTMAEAEELVGHKNAVSVRLQALNKQ